MNNTENAQAKSLIVNYVVIILLLSLLWLLYEGVRCPPIPFSFIDTFKHKRSNRATISWKHYDVMRVYVAQLQAF